MILIGIPHAIRSALFFFFLIFLLRALLRNQWAAGVAFAAMLACLSLADASHPLFNTSIDFVVLLGMAIVMLRWGLLAYCSLLLFTMLSTVPGARTTAWFFGESVFLVALALAMAAWAFHVSLGGRKLWKEDFFG